MFDPTCLLTLLYPGFLLLTLAHILTMPPDSCFYNSAACLLSTLDFKLAFASILVPPLPSVSDLACPGYSSSPCTCKFLCLPCIPALCAHLVQASPAAQHLPDCFLICCCIWTCCKHFCHSLSCCTLFPIPEVTEQ